MQSAMSLRAAGLQQAEAHGTGGTQTAADADKADVAMQGSADGMPAWQSSSCSSSSSDGSDWGRAWDGLEQNLESTMYHDAALHASTMQGTGAGTSQGSWSMAGSPAGGSSALPTLPEEGLSPDAEDAQAGPLDDMQQPAAALRVGACHTGHDRLRRSHMATQVLAPAGADSVDATASKEAYSTAAFASGDRTSGSSQSAEEHAASDAEILTGDEAVTLSLLRVKVTNTAVTLWPEALTLATQLCRAAAAGKSEPSSEGAIDVHHSEEFEQSGAGQGKFVAQANSDVNSQSCVQSSGAGSGASGAQSSLVSGPQQSTGHAIQSACTVPAHAAQDEPCGCEQLLAQSTSVTLESQGAATGSADAEQAAAAALAALNQRELAAAAHAGTDGQLSSHDGAEPAAEHVLRPADAPDSGAAGSSSPECSHSEAAAQVHVDELSPGTRAAQARANHMHRTLFADATSELDGGSRRWSASGASSRYIDAHSRATSGGLHAATHAGAGLLGPFMHDTYHAGECMVAVGAPLHSGTREDSTRLLSIPTEQEDDGVLDAAIASQTGGLASALRTDYVGTTGSVPGAAVRAPEATIGRLPARYPDSATRVTATASCVSITLQERAPAVRRRAHGGEQCRARLTASSVNVQLDLFTPGAGAFARAAVSVQRFAAHQAGSVATGATASGQQGAQMRSTRHAAGAAQDDATWRPLAVHLRHGPRDKRADMLRLLVRAEDDAEDGPRHATVSLRLPSLRIRLEQPTVTFLRVRFLSWTMCYTWHAPLLADQMIDYIVWRRRYMPHCRRCPQRACCMRTSARVLSANMLTAPALQAFAEEVQAASAPASPVRSQRASVSPTQSHAAPADPAHMSAPAASARSAKEPRALAASADSLMMLVSIEEPSAAYATLANMLFKAVDVHPFVIALDYHPVKVCAGTALLSIVVDSQMIHADSSDLLQLAPRELLLVVMSFC